MAKRKIAFIITKLQLGGAQKSVLYSVENLPKNKEDKFETYLLCGPGGFLDEKAKKEVKNLFFIPNLQRKINLKKDFLAFKEIRTVLKKIKPDIVHTNSSKAGLIGRFAAASLGIKCVHTVHGFAFNSEQKLPVKMFYILLETFCSLMTKKVIFVANTDMELAKKYHITSDKKIVLIRAGVEVKTRQDFPLFNKEKKLKELNLTKENKIVLSIANLKPQKNPLDMIRIAKIVCNKFPKTVFLYLGTGPLKEDSEKLIKEYHLENNFKLLGHRTDTSELLLISDVFALSSLWEGLPMALVEALFMQVPAVCYNVNGIKEVLQNGKNGFLIPPKNKQKAAQSIIKILEGSFKFTSLDLTDFDINTMVKNQAALYESLLK